MSSPPAPLLVAPEHVTARTDTFESRSKLKPELRPKKLMSRAPRGLFWWIKERVSSRINTLPERVEAHCELQRFVFEFPFFGLLLSSVVSPSHARLLTLHSPQIAQDQDATVKQVADVSDSKKSVDVLQIADTDQRQRAAVNDRYQRPAGSVSHPLIIKMFLATDIYVVSSDWANSRLYSPARRDRRQVWRFGRHPSVRWSQASPERGQRRWIPLSRIIGQSSLPPSPLSCSI